MRSTPAAGIRRQLGGSDSDEGVREDSDTVAGGIGPRAHTLVPLTLSAELAPAELPAYGRLLLDVFTRDPALSIRGDEAEESWRVVTPVLAAWADDLVPLQNYAAGSDGPETRRERPSGN